VRNNDFLLVIIAVWLFILPANSYSANVPSGQDAGAAVQRASEEQTQKAIKSSLKEEKQAEVEGKESVEQAQPAQAPTDAATKTLIARIQVEGTTLLSAEEIKKVTSLYEGKELSLADFREVADKISDLYRRKGYVTSSAFIRPQKIENNTLIVSTVEGRVGNVSVTGNKWFKTKLLLKYIALNPNEMFNYDVLRQNILRMNEHPDVNGRVVLSRGEAPGATNVDVQVKERRPFHATLGYNNYNSKYLDRNKYSAELKSTNFLGFGDILSGEVQAGDNDRYYLGSARYLFPLNPLSSVGFYYLHVNQSLGRSLEASDIEGEGDLMNVYFSHRLIDSENFVLTVNPGFEYKNIGNTVAGTVSGQDDTRVARLGFDLDMTDAWRARTILTQEFDYGIPDFMGGSEARDQEMSRPGAAGEFFRTVTNVARIQPMPLSTVLLLKGAGQFTNNTLPSSEQFQVGGYYTVRGYPVSELSGDKGYTLSAELYTPIYFIPKIWRVPHAKATWRDALSFVTFFDYGNASNNSPRTGELKSETIYSAGAGLRFNLTGQAYVSFDYGWALGQEASDGKDSQGYIETKLFF
jgi:hemolysin activation/secretion protein